MIYSYRMLLLFLIMLTACCGGQEKKPIYGNGDAVIVTGIISVSGNEPFTRIVLRTSDGKEAFFLPDSLKKDKNSFIGKTVRVSGKINIRILESADHKHTVYEYHIMPDKIETDSYRQMK